MIMGRGVPQGYMNKVSTTAIFLINKTQVDTFRQTDRQTDRQTQKDRHIQNGNTLTAQPVSF